VPAAIVEHLLSQRRAHLSRLDERHVMRGHEGVCGGGYLRCQFRDGCDRSAYFAACAARVCTDGTVVDRT